MTLQRLNPDLLDTDPVAYLRDLFPVAVEALDEVQEALLFHDMRKLRPACLRLESVGALAGIIGRKLDAE